MRLVSLFCLIALVLVALLSPGDYEFVLAHPTVTRSNNSNSRYEKRAMLTVAASTSANGSTGSSALELPSVASSNNIYIGEDSATAGTNKQLINNPHIPSLIPIPSLTSNTPSISATPTTNRTKSSTSTSTTTTTTTTTKTTTKTKTNTTTTTTTPISPITPTTPTSPITPTTLTSPITPTSTSQSASPTSMPPTTSSGSSQTPALLLPPEPASASGSESNPIPLNINEAQPNTSQNSPVNSDSDPATSQPNGQQTNNQNPAVDTTGSDGSGSPGGFGGSGGSGGSDVSGGPGDSSSPGGAKPTNNQNNQNFVSQGSMSNKLLGPVIGGTIATLAGFGMAFLVVVRKRKSASLGLQLQSGSWDDYDSIEPPTEPITRFRPASFLFAVRSVVNKLPLPRDSANITGESKFVEKMDFDEY